MHCRTPSTYATQASCSCSHWDHPDSLLLQLFLRGSPQASMSSACHHTMDANVYQGLMC